MSPQEIEALVRRYNDNLTAREAADAKLAKARWSVEGQFPTVGRPGDEVRYFWEVFWRSFDFQQLSDALAEVKAAQSEAGKLHAEGEDLAASLKEQGLGRLIR